MMQHITGEDFVRILTKLETFLDATVTLDPPGPTVTMGEATSDAYSPELLSDMLNELVEIDSVPHHKMEKIVQSINRIIEENTKLRGNYETDY